VPYNGTVYLFNRVTVGTLNEVGGIYILAKPSSQRGLYDALYVGRTDNLRRRLGEHLNDPPVAGATHFFAELCNTELQRIIREAELIREFQPIGNTQGRW
jgi:excinuclease UvrABC nuclease subunit